MKLKSIACTIICVLSSYLFTFKSTIPGRIIMAPAEVYTEGIVYDKVWYTYAQLPDKVKVIMADDNYRIYVVDEITNDDMIAGRTSYGPRIIEIRNTDYYVERTMFHECGHILDKNLVPIGYISSSDEFKEIYLAEKDNFTVDNNYNYFVSDEAEYFASAFAEYMMNPERLKENTPRTYYFIENCLK